MPRNGLPVYLFYDWNLLIDTVIGIGPFADRGNMAIFRTRESAESFVKEDPFILEGLVRSYVIRDWNGTMLE